MKYETPLEAVKAFYRFLEREYRNRLIICKSTLEAAKVAEYLTKYDVGEVVLNKFTQESHDEYIKEVCILHEQVNLDKPREEFEYFLSLYAQDNWYADTMQAFEKHVGEIMIELSDEKSMTNMTEFAKSVASDNPSETLEKFQQINKKIIEDIKGVRKEIEEMFSQFDHISFYEECCIAVLKPQYNYSDWCKDFGNEYNKTHPRN